MPYEKTTQWAQEYVFLGIKQIGIKDGRVFIGTFGVVYQERKVVIDGVERTQRRPVNRPDVEIITI